MTKIPDGYTFIDMIELRKSLRKTRGYKFLEKHLWIFDGRGAGEICDSDT